VHFADILGFSKLIEKQKEKAGITLTKFGEIIEKHKREYESSSISSHQFSDQVVVGFKKTADALSFSKHLFYDAFFQEIPLRGTIGIGDFTHKPNLQNKSSFTIGSGLVLATFAEKYSVKGHTLLIVCKDDKAEEMTHFGDLTFLDDKDIHDLPKDSKAYIVRWWKRPNHKKIKNEIDKRTNGLDVETINYLEKTKEHMEYFQDETMELDEY
jgi:hypothetical protein